MVAVVAAVAAVAVVAVVVGVIVVVVIVNVAATILSSLARSPLHKPGSADILFIY